MSQQVSRPQPQKRNELEGLVEHQTIFSNLVLGSEKRFRQVLKKAEKYQEDARGYLATLPYLLAFSETENLPEKLLKTGITAYSIIAQGTDIEGRFARKNATVAAILHGAGLLGGESLFKSDSSNFYNVSKEDFQNLLNGRLPSGEHIEIYSVKDVRQGKVENPFGRYGVVLESDPDEDIHIKTIGFDDPFYLAFSGGLALKGEKELRMTNGAGMNEMAFLYLDIPSFSIGTIAVIATEYIFVGADTPK